MSRISENIRKMTKAWGGKTTGNGISDALSDLYNNLPFGVKTEMVEIVPQQGVMQIDEEGQLLYLIKDGFTIENGKEYKAVVDGVSYDVIGMSESGIYAVTDTGDLDAATLYFICDSSGVAFPIPEGYGSVAMFPNGTANTRVAIYEEKEIVTPLPAKFMPEPIVFTTPDGQTFTCNKTYAECLEYYNSNVFNAVIKNPLAGVIPCIQYIYMADEGVIAFVFNIGGEKTGIMYTIDGSITIETMPQ